MFQVLKIPPEEGPPPLWVTAWGGGQVVDLMGEISPAQSACTFFQLVYNEFVGGDSTNHRRVRQPGEVFQSL